MAADRARRHAGAACHCRRAACRRRAGAGVTAAAGARQHDRRQDDVRAAAGVPRGRGADRRDAGRPPSPSPLLVLAGRACRPWGRSPGCVPPVPPPGPPSVPWPVPPCVLPPWPVPRAGAARRWSCHRRRPPPLPPVPPGAAGAAEPVCVEVCVPEPAAGAVLVKVMPTEVPVFLVGAASVCVAALVGVLSGRTLTGAATTPPPPRPGSDRVGERGEGDRDDAGDRDRRQGDQGDRRAAGARSQRPSPASACSRSLGSQLLDCHGDCPRPTLLCHQSLTCGPAVPNDRASGYSPVMHTECLGITVRRARYLRYPSSVLVTQTFSAHSL